MLVRVANVLDCLLLMYYSLWSYTFLYDVCFALWPSKHFSLNILASLYNSKQAVTNTLTSVKKRMKNRVYTYTHMCSDHRSFSIETVVCILPYYGRWKWWLLHFPFSARIGEQEMMSIKWSWTHNKNRIYINQILDNTNKKKKKKTKSQINTSNEWSNRENGAMSSQIQFVEIENVISRWRNERTRLIHAFFSSARQELNQHWKWTNNDK